MSSASFVGECVFFDVGQGTANVILLGGGRAILIDVGPERKGAVYQFLSDHVSSIECVVLSHNDDDHVAGWEEIAMRFGEQIRKIWLLQDREIKKGNLLDVTMALVTAGVIPRPMRAEVRDLRKPRKVWSDPALGLSVTLLYPDMLANLRAAQAHRPNRTCAIVMVQCSGGKILFAGDSSLDAWRTLQQHSSAMPTTVEIFAVPHHGGLSQKEASSADVAWLYKDAIRSKVAVLSVGTKNQHNHPRRELVDALHSSGSYVMCTQLTKKCHSRLEELEQVVKQGTDSSCVAASKRKGAIPCAGTIVATLSHDGIEIDRHEDHRRAVGERVSSPMCRPDIVRP